METSRIVFVSVTLPAHAYERLNNSVTSSTAQELPDMAYHDPHEAYRTLISSALANSEISVELTVNDTQIKCGPTEGETLILADRFESVPDSEITPIQILLSVWRKPKFIEILKNRSLKPVKDHVLNFYTKPPGLAF